MATKPKKIAQHLLYIVLSNTIFGLIYYFAFKWLASYSIVYAYLGSVSLIVLGLVMDKQVKEMLVSAKLMEELKRLSKDERRKNYKIIHWLMDSFVSFKTVLFIFYVLILIASQVISLAPTLVSNDVKNFIFANTYGIVLLISFERIITQFTKDRNDMTKISAEFESSFKKIQDLQD